MGWTAHPAHKACACRSTIAKERSKNKKQKGKKNNQKTDRTPKHAWHARIKATCNPNEGQRKKSESKVRATPATASHPRAKCRASCAKGPATCRPKGRLTAHQAADHMNTSMQASMRMQARHASKQTTQARHKGTTSCTMHNDATRRTVVTTVHAGDVRVPDAQSTHRRGLNL